MNFDEVADELYSLTPEEFTATRNEREKQAKSDGDKELAGRIRKLAKPNASAWLANRLVREHPEEIQPLLELGEDLRAAMADRDGGRLRELAKTQRLLISALVDEAKQDATNAGRKVADEAARGLVDTLRSALADDRSARELLAGRLTAPLFRSGLEGDDDSPDNGADERPPAPARSTTGRAAGGGAGGKAATESGKATRKSAASKGSGAKAAADQDAQADQDAPADQAAQDERAEAARRAGEVAEAAEALATDARSDDDAARQAVTDAGTEIEQLRERITELEAELEAATAALSAAKTAARRAGIDLQRAERAAAAARRRADALQDD